MAHWFQLIGSKGASELKLSEVKALLELFSKCDSTYSSDSFTNIKEILKNPDDMMKENNVVIQRPNAGLLGMTTPDKLAESLTKMMVKDGLLNRFVFMFAQEGDQKMNRKSKPKPVPQGILSWIETIERRVMHENREKKHIGRNDPKRPLNPIVLSFSDESLDLLDKYEDLVLKRKKELRITGIELMIARNIEKAMRLALTVELAKDPYASEISADSMEFSINLVDFTFEQMIDYIKFEMVENSIDKRYRDAYNVVERFGTTGVQKSELNKLHPFKSCSSQQRREIYDYLIFESQEVVQVEVPTEGKGRNPSYLYASKFVEKE